MILTIELSSMSPRTRKNVESAMALAEKDFISSYNNAANSNVSTFNSKIIKRNPFKSKKYETSETEPNPVKLNFLKRIADYDFLITEENKRKVRFSLLPVVKREESIVPKIDLDEVKKKDDERIIIGDDTFLKSDVNLITKKVLQKCNYFRNKNKNNNKILKTGEGKLAITGGMSVAEFTNKYKF